MIKIIIGAGIMVAIWLQLILDGNIVLTAILSILGGGGLVAFLMLAANKRKVNREAENLEIKNMEGYDAVREKKLSNLLEEVNQLLGRVEKYEQKNDRLELLLAEAQKEKLILKQENAVLKSELTGMLVQIEALKSQHKR